MYLNVPEIRKRLSKGLKSLKKQNLYVTQCNTMREGININVEIEKGKAIIQLAQIIMIFAGFILAISGVAYTNSVNSLAVGIKNTNDFSSNILFEEHNNLTHFQKGILNNTIELNSSFLESIQPQLDLIIITLKIGFAFALISIGIWFYGYHILKKGFIR
jgi:hypothetical protein